MSVVSLLGVEVKNNPARFDEPYEFEITFECLEQLQKGICIIPFARTVTKEQYRPRMEVDLRRFRYLVRTRNCARATGTC
jgi:tRNA U38,U39,U40 pseudouridine synthase TruA